MKFALAGIVAILITTQARAQIQATPDFDDLARRAAAAMERNPQEAAALYRQGVRLRPAWAEGWFYLGAGEYQLKHYPEAREALARAGALAADNGAAWAFLGLAEYELADYAQALTHIWKAEELGLPDNPQFVSVVRLRAALISMRSSDFTAAIEQLRPLAMGGDKTPAVIEAFGLAALTMPFLPGSVPAGTRPLVDLAGRAIWALYAQQWADADAGFQQLGEQYAKEPGVHYLRGIYYVDRDMAAALNEFRAELKISPAHALARVQIAILHLRMGEPDAALEPAREAVRLAPGNLLCHLALGRALLAVEKTGPAIAEFEAALKLDPAYPHTHFYLGQAYRQAGRDEDSRREQAEFTRLQGAGNPTAGAGPPRSQK
jgi:tetratricopeptide (TPR) repeat protein